MNEWEVWNADVAFIEKQLNMSQESKVRPCLVIISKLNDEWLAYPITGTKRDKHYEIRDWKEAGLDKPSYLVYDSAKPVKGLSIKSFRGKLSDYDIQRIKSERLLKEMTSYTILEKSDLLTEEDIRQRYINNGLDPDIDRTPGPRDDGTYYDKRGFHWRPNPSGGNDILISEVTKDGHVVCPIEDLEWWTYD